MELIKNGDAYCINVSDLCLNIYKYIHVTNLSDKIKNLTKEERFLLCNYVVTTYGSSESKETDSLIENLSELESEVDVLIQYEDSKLEDKYYLDLISLLKVNNEDVYLNDIKLSFNNELINELSKEEALILLRDEKLDQLFGS